MSQTLQAALGDPAIAELVQAGRLHQAASYGGFGPDDLTARASRLPRPASALADGGEGTARSARGALPSSLSRPGRGRAEAATPRTREAADDARTAAEEAEAAADEATAHADELADQVESLRPPAAGHRDRRARGPRAARAARKRYTELRREAAAAEQAAARAETRG